MLATVSLLPLTWWPSLHYVRRGISRGAAPAVRRGQTVQRLTGRGEPRAEGERFLEHLPGPDDVAGVPVRQTHHVRDGGA